MFLFSSSMFCYSISYAGKGNFPVLVTSEGVFWFENLLPTDTDNTNQTEIPGQQLIAQPQIADRQPTAQPQLGAQQSTTAQQTRGVEHEYEEMPAKLEKRMHQMQLSNGATLALGAKTIIALPDYVQLDNGATLTLDAKKIEVLPDHKYTDDEMLDIIEQHINQLQLDNLEAPLSSSKNIVLITSDPGNLGITLVVHLETESKAVRKIRICGTFSGSTSAKFKKALQDRYSKHVVIEWVVSCGDNTVFTRTSLPSDLDRITDARGVDRSTTSAGSSSKSSTISSSTDAETKREGLPHIHTPHRY